MDDRTSALSRIVSAQSEKTKAAAKYAKSKRKKRNPQRELHAEWSVRFREAMGDIEVPPWGPAERSLARKLSSESGIEKALDLVRHFLATWSQRTFDGVPSIRLMWVIRQRLFAEMDGSVKVNAKRDRLLSDEWDVKSKDGPSEGWG